MKKQKKLMINKIDKIAVNLAKAFNKNKFIEPIPEFYTKNIIQANKLRKLCENRIQQPVIGFKAGGTGIAMLKKLKEKEPFYASVFKNNFLNNNKRVKINKYTLGIELEVCYKIQKSFFLYKKKITINNVKRFITHMAPCIEIVGYRQKKRGIKYLGDLCSDFGANFKFIIGPQKIYKNIKIGNLKTKIFNHKKNHFVEGNTNTVYKNPLNALIFVLNKLKKENINLNKDFYVFTGSTVGVVPILGKGNYIGNIEKLGSVKVKIV